jgi:hypothetical protein
VVPNTPRDPCSNVVDFLSRAGVDASRGLPYADKIFIGGRLLSVITLAAKGLIELEADRVDRLQIDRLVVAACEALQDVGSAIREPPPFPPAG